MAAAAATGNKNLYECPTNVKEALEWLVAFGPVASQCAQVIKDKKIIEGFNDGNQAKGLCDAANAFLEAIKTNGGSYKSAYNGAQWSQLCTTQGSGKCCGNNPACSGCTAGQCDGCCAKCPKQICARIFCLIVPVLYRVFWYMQAKCNKGKAWASQKLNESNGSNGQDHLKLFMELCGFEADKLAENKTGGQLTRNNGNNELGSLMEALGQMKQVIEKALENNDPSKNFLKDATNQKKETKPSTLTDLLLWLQFLPYCLNYHEVIEAVKKKINGNDKEKFVQYLNDAISHLPMLFLQIEGPGRTQGNAQGSSLFLKISELSKCQYIYDQKYYEDKEKVCKMLLCVFPVIHWGLTALKDRCNDSNCSSTLTACESTKKLLQSLGWNGNKASSSANEFPPIIHENAKCQPLKDYLDKYLLGNSSALAGMKKILEGAWQRENGPTGFNNNGSYLPRTIYEMLIWLMGLPVSDKFKEFKKESGVSDVMQSFTEILFEVPNLFLTLNGDLSGMLGELFKCQGIETGSSGGGTTFNYGNDGSDCLKIFSAIVAILYPVIRYLQQRCNGNGGSVFTGDASWSTKKTNEKPLSEFLVFMGFGSTIASSTAVSGSEFHSTVLQPIFGDVTQNGGNDKLGKLYECAIEQLKKNSTGGSHTPSTIRQMMLWLIGLPVTKEYGDNGTGLIKTITERATGINDVSSKIKNGNNDLEVQLQHSIVGMMTIISQIEGGLKSVVEFLKEGFKDGTNKLKYESDTSTLFQNLTTYVTSVHVQLRFLNVMCGRQKDQGGWQECKYSNKHFATGSGIKCNCSDKLTIPCNNSPLRHFLNSTSNKNQYKQGSELVEMGFTGTVNSPNIGYTGKDIYTYLKDIIDPIDTSSQSTSSKPLSLLTQYCVAIGQLHPSSLGDLFAFFAHLGHSWDSLGLYGPDGGQKFKDKLEKELTDYKIGQNGDQKQACDQLKTAIKAILNSEHSSHDSKKSLVSLMCDQSTCSPYMKSLSQGMYHYYCPSITASDNFPFLQYLYDMLRKLLDKMKELKGAFEKCPCCQSGTPCSDLISCPNAHPILYKFGFVFGDPSKLTGKKCQDIKAQLGVVLSCTKDQESTLFSAFECVIQVTYSILLQKAKGKVNGIYNTSTNGDTPASGLKSTNQEMNTAFTLYVTNAMYDSYPKLICTFACKVFDSGHDCSNSDCKKRFTAPGPAPTTIIADLSTSTTLQVTKSAVTTITAVIPQYTAPVIDRYHYKAFQKTTTDGKSSATYNFQSALDFHIKGAQCIAPSPVSLRSVIDWMLRVTVGVANEKNNENIKELSDAVKSVLEGSGVSITDSDKLQSCVTDLVQGLRKFMGYQDRSGEVKEGVSKELGDDKNNNGVKGELQKKIEVLNKFIGQEGSAQFGTEMGKALLKGRYAGTFKQKREGLADTLISTIAAVAQTVTGIKEPLEQKTFKDAVKTFTEILSSTHEGCKELQCNTLNNSAAASQGDDQKGGLEILKEFLSAILNFATYRDNINKGHDNTVFIQLQSAEVLVQGQALCAKYFSILLKALTDIGECYKKMGDLITPNGSITSTSQYRSKIDELKKALEKAIEELTEKDGEKGSKADVRCAVSAATALMKKTKERTDGEITKQIRTGFEGVYPYIISEHRKLDILRLVSAVETATSSKLTTYHSHLDDLKALCQWLYRMGQLYAHGLKGFVESLITHLEHIIQVIKWIEKLHKNLNSLNKEIEKYGTEDSIGFTRLSVRYIEDLLHRTYVLHELPQGTDQNNNDKQTVQARIQLLLDFRLLALDRYTLQVWQDNKNHIKDWITFSDGIIRHSDLNTIKEALKDLTGIAYNKSSPDSHSPTNRIHNFHAICVLQKFSFEAPITRLERSLEKLRVIQGQLSAVKEKCNAGTQDLSSDPVVTSFCKLVDAFLAEEYGIYSFAKFVHTIMGPNVFSAVIGALEHVKSTNELNASEDKKKKFCGIVTTMCEGLQSDTEKREHYTLKNICKKLESFITTIRREYIFSYPVVTCTAQTKAAQSQPQALTTATEHTAQSIMDRLKNVMLPCAKNFHNDASVCNSCYNIFAYILLGQVPKLYHSFKFMSWISSTEWKSNASDASITFYLVSMGYEDQKIQNVQSGNQNTGGKQLHETFKSAVDGFKNNPSPPTPSYEPKGLKDIHDKLESYLKKLLQVQHEQALQAMLKSGTDTRRRPRTIREMLHWLSGVPFSVVYEDMQKFSNSLCDSTLALTNDNGEQKMKHTIQPEWISYRLGVSCAECLDVLQAVEDPLGKEPQKRYREYIATHDFYYPASPSELFYMFVDIIYNVYVQMKFVCNMTGRERNDGGWKSCEFINTKALILQNYNKDTVQCKCNLNFVEYTCAGPLRRLLSSVSTVFTGKSLGFQLPEEKLYDASVVGSVIHNVIKHIFGKGDNYPTLCRFLLAVSTCPPTSIGDMISFLYWYKQRMFVGNSADENSKKTADIYKNALHHEIELFPGTFDASKLTGALGALMSAHTGTSGRTTSGTTHTHNLSSVMYCEDAMVVKPQPQPPAPAPQTQQPSDPSASCAPYLRPLAQEIYNVYVPQFSRAYLSWILHFGPRVYTALEELKGKLNGNCEHCKKSDSSIVTCNSVLPELYSKGLDFYDPKVLNGQKKNQRDGSYQPNGGTKRGCNALITQLGEVLKPCNPKDPSAAAPLHRLIEAIEQFLWSIRMPFSLVQLSLWSVAILFISYVFVVPLDHFKIKSHLFNRLKYTMHPSLLIADQQRRVSEVAYFSL